MSRYDSLLKYQEIDLRMRKHEVKIESNESFVRAKQAQDQYNTAKKNAESCETKAEETVQYFAKMQSVCQDIENKLLELEAISVDDTNYLKVKDQLDKLYRNLSKIESDLDIISKRVNEIENVYKESTKRGHQAKVIFNESRDKFVDFKAEEDKAISALKQELDKLRPSIDKPLMDKYAVLRRDKTLPAVVKVNLNLDGLMCTGCMMELSMNAKSRLKADGTIDCENCHRIIIATD